MSEPITEIGYTIPDSDGNAVDTVDSTITGNDGNEKIVVTGGCCGSAYSSTEIYSVEDDFWTPGKYDCI